MNTLGQGQFGDSYGEPIPPGWNESTIAKNAQVALKPCPFCGTPDPIIDKTGNYLVQVRCLKWDCMAVVQAWEEEDAVRHWNRRVNE